MNEELKPVLLRASLALLLVFIGPVVLTIGYKIMDKNIVLLIIGILLCALALFFGVTALLKMLKYLFNKDR